MLVPVGKAQVERYGTNTSDQHRELGGDNTQHRKGERGALAPLRYGVPPPASDVFVALIEDDPSVMSRCTCCTGSSSVASRSSTSLSQDCSTFRKASLSCRTDSDILPRHMNHLDTSANVEKRLEYRSASDGSRARAVNNAWQGLYQIE
ncbi:hypothetical protein KCU81_g776, partial [Aureobasidium melanogenum]